MADFTYTDIAKMIDHSLLQQVLTDKQLEEGCRLARAYDAASVCIKPYAVPLAAALLRGFDRGGRHHHRLSAWRPRHRHQGRGSRASHGRWCHRVGYGGQHRQSARRRLCLCGQRHHRRGSSGPSPRGLVKVIFENCFLKDEQKEQLCRICGEIGADYRENVHRLRRRRRDRRGFEIDAPLFAAESAGQGRRRRAHLRAVAASRALGVQRVGATATKVILDDCRKQLGLSPIVG